MSGHATGRQVIPDLPPWLLAAVMCTSLILGLAIQVSPSRAATGAPVVLSGATAGPVDVAMKPKTVARLDLPSGRWLATAKAVIGGPTDPFVIGVPLVSCDLELAGKRTVVDLWATDRVLAAPGSAGSGGSRVPILLTAPGRLRSPGYARLACSTGEAEHSVTVSHIRITAIKAGRLTTGRLGAGGTTTGSGSPRVLSRFDDVDVSIPGDGQWKTVADMNLTAGRWWLMTKAVASGASTPSINLQCRLATAGGRPTAVPFGLASSSDSGGQLPIFLQAAVRLKSSSLARLECKGDRAFTVGRPVIDAIKVGRLYRWYVDWPTEERTWGSGHPRVSHIGHDGGQAIPAALPFSQLVPVDLPAGRWTLLAHLVIHSGLGLLAVESGERKVTCRLAVGSRRDVAHVIYGAGGTAVAPIMLSLTYRSDSPSRVSLECRRGADSSTVLASSIRVTALKTR